MSRFVLDRVALEFKPYVIAIHDQHGDETVIVKREALPKIFEFLKNDPEMAFEMLLDVTAVDCLKMKNRPLGLPDGYRFFVVYHMRSLSKKHRLRVKVPLKEDDPVVPTAYYVWRGADWFERETFDMFGIRFEGHPDLRRILLYDEFKGYPLRKDYPLRGYQPRIPMPNLKGDPVPDIEEGK